VEEGQGGPVEEEGSKSQMPTFVTAHTIGFSEESASSLVFVTIRENTTCLKKNTKYIFFTHLLLGRKGKFYQECSELVGGCTSGCFSHIKLNRGEKFFRQMYRVSIKALNHLFSRYLHSPWKHRK
jgi:hypothetical protein